MPVSLVVTQPFGTYVTGQQISDPDEVAKVLAGHNEGHVVKVAVPEPPPKVEAEKK